MKEFLDYLVKNKYVIICICIVIVLYALGIVEFLTKFVVLLALLALAIFVGKKLQDNDGKLKDFFTKIFKDKDFKGFKNVYYYQSKDDEK